MEYKRIRPAQTLLDSINPRLPDGTSNDKEAVNRLLEDGYSQMLALARDILERGEGNPAELPIVMKDSGKYVVLEGNRRFAALKLLADPRLADKPTHRSAFERLKSKGNTPPKSLYCVVVNNREDADPWIRLRHTGANNGVGVRTWGAEQNARYKQRLQAPLDRGTARAITISDELTEAYQADLRLVELIKKVRTEKLTNIGRFFSGATLTRMQFEIRPDSPGGTERLWTRHTADQLHAYFVWSFQFLEEQSVDAFKNDSLRGELLNSNSHLLPSSNELLTEHQRLADHPFTADSAAEPDSPKSTDGFSDLGADDTQTAGSGGSTETPAPDDVGRDSGSGAGTGATGTRDARPERSLYSKVRLSNLSTPVQRLLKEARSLRIDDSYAISCVLARVILELAVSDPKVLAWSGKSEGDQLAEKVRGCILKLDPDIDRSRKRIRQDLMQAHLEIETIGVNYLHQFMHNPHAKSDPHLARRYSQAFSPLLSSINEAVA